MTKGMLMFFVPLWILAALAGWYGGGIANLVLKNYVHTAVSQVYQERGCP